MHPAFCLHSSSRSFKRETCLCFANFNPSWIPHENEAVTFEILRDVNSVVCHRSSDPLFAIMDAETRGCIGKAISGVRSLSCRICSYGRYSTRRVWNGCRSGLVSRIDPWIRYGNYFFSARCYLPEPTNMVPELSVLQFLMTHMYYPSANASAHLLWYRHFRPAVGIGPFDLSIRITWSKHNTK
ncbi:hypothetical protein L208DRAFT_25144 [Tricholoma matsutake]|nr:hypothetical protein L208DRAFT_25144 [Tricholoma matsutake 945]